MGETLFRDTGAMIGRKSQIIQILKRFHTWGGGLSLLAPNQIIMGGLAPLAPDKLCP